MEKEFRYLIKSDIKKIKFSIYKFPFTKVGDELALLNAKWQKYLGSASSFINNHARADNFKQGWKILIYSSYLKQKAQKGNEIKGGSVIRLFHL